MLGEYTRGMTVKISIGFRTNGQPIPVENVVVRIEHYDNEEGKFVNDLNETPMKQINASDYLYNYEIPQALKEGNYLVHMTAKVPQQGGKIFEGLENFSIVSPETLQKTSSPLTPDIAAPKITVASEVNSHINNLYSDLPSEKLIEDIVVDVENKPIGGVHVNVFMKKDFIPNDQSNIKVTSTMTSPDGRWSVKIPHGEYVFTYRGIGLKEVREFRKV